jgi:hypothetical protein
MNRFLLTMQYDESLMLPIFLKHYSQYFSAKNIFVIDHGSKTSLIPDGFNRIYVPRDRPFSEAARLDLVKKIIQGLLNYYDLGVYADCDELISFQNVNFNSLADEVTYVAGFEVFLNKSNQLIGALNPLECKPLIFKKTPAWNLGFHSSNAKPSILSIPMAHIRYFNRELTRDRLIGRRTVHKNMDKTEGSHGIAAHWGDGDRELNEFYSYIESNQANISTAKTFDRIQWNEVFNISTPESLYVQMEPRFHAKGDYKIFGGQFYNLTNFFPMIL